mgnify:CR=1 FL=1
MSIVRHFELHGLAGAPTLKTLVVKSPLIGKVSELEARVLSLNTRVALDELVQSFRGPYAHKHKMALALTNDVI